MQDKKLHDKIEEVDLGEALSERYLSYALSTIMSRSLPDVRDGLKPVHRRLLYAMLQLRLDPSSAYKKCARVVGDVIGKYHPHGDTAVYETLVRLAQNFSLRYPLIEGQGNFGSIDGDNAAAMRYTESKLTEIAMLLTEDLEKNTVDFRPTYDNADLEPVLMPSAFPNLLANGSEGIAVGMATSIPPHNLHELCEALEYLIEHPTAETEDLLKFVKGPDFPTGGIVVEPHGSISSSYKTGKGSFKVRAKWFKEEFSHGLYRIIVTEIPYQVQKSKLIEQIAELLHDKKLPLIANIRDESAEDIRIVIEPKNRNCPPESIMESLFKLSALETRVHLNMNVLGRDGIPRVMNLAEVLKEFLSHRKEIVLRRCGFLIEKIVARMEILEGLRVAYLNLDEVIRIVREEDEPKEVMISTFNITAVQAEAILNTRLRSLRKLEEEEILREHERLKREHADLTDIVENPGRLWKSIKSEIEAVRKKFGYESAIGARRTNFELPITTEILDISAFVEREPITILLSKMGWIRSVKGHGYDLSTIKYKEGDDGQFILEAYTTDNILICSSGGKFFMIRGSAISGGKGSGDSIKLIIDIGQDDVTALMTYKPNQKILLACTNGKGFIVTSDDLIAKTKLGKQVMNVPSDAYSCLFCKPIDGEDTVATIGENRKLCVFRLSEIPEMKRGGGVTLQKFKNAKLSDIKLFKAEEGLSWRLGDRLRIEKDLVKFLSKRGATGRLPPVGFPKDNKFH